MARVREAKLHVSDEDERDAPGEGPVPSSATIDVGPLADMVG